MSSVALKSSLIYFVGFIVLHLITYIAAGILAVNGLGAGQYYPPSPKAINFLAEIPPPSMIIPAQSLRGLLFAFALFPFRRRSMQLGQYHGGLAVTAVLFLVGEIASSGGIIERFVYYKPIPLGFIGITFIEILIQTLLLGQLLMLWEKRFNKAFYATSQASKG